MMKVLVGLFLIAHGLLHLSYLSPAPPPSENGPTWPFKLDESWLLTRLGIGSTLVHGIGTVLAVVAAGAFVIAALGRLGLFDGWALPAGIGAVSGLLLLALYWHLWLSLGVLINLAILVLALQYK